MQKLIFILIALSTPIYSHKTYVLLPSIHDYKIVVKETEHTTSSGYSYYGDMSTYNSTQSCERYLDPKDALDLAIRHENMPILLAALNKLERFHETVDISSALLIICTNLQDAHSHKKSGYIFSGILGTLSVLPWLCRNEVISRPYYYYSYRRTTGETIVISGIFATFAALCALGTHVGFKDSSKTYLEMVHVLLNSRACILRDVYQLKALLATIHPLLTLDDQIKLSCCLR